MIKIQNVGNEAIQEHTILFQEFEIIFTLRFYPKLEAWFFDVEFLGRSVKGVKLAVGTLHILSHNFPFDFYVIDNSGNGLEPLSLEDFSTERCSLLMFEEDDMINIRNGASVPF